MITFRPSARFDQSAAVIFFDQEQFSRQSFSHLHNPGLIKALGALHKHGPFKAEANEIFPLMLDKRLFLLAGLGKKEDLNATSLRSTIRSALISSYLKNSSGVEVVPHEQKDPTVKAIIQGILIGTYSWSKYKTTKSGRSSQKEHHYYVVAFGRKEFIDCVTVCEGVKLARDLINENADIATSDYFEKVIRDLVKWRKSVKLTVLNQKELKAKGLNLHIAVNQGSNKEPKLIIVEYSGASAKEPAVALIGKGMTYDTGGLNLKPTGHIETMRCDMSGAAAVVGTLKNALALNLKRNVLFVVALAENAIDAEAYKPGDVFKSYNGMTVEIGNTDAEGRLVLADAISYVVRNYKPARIIDIATLTGACVVALAHDYTGLVTTSDTFSRELVRCSNETDDKVWRLPSYPGLKDAVKSEIADIRNMGFPKGAGGTITAAEFLRQFTEGTEWAHLDIAGTAFLEGKGRNYFGHGGTGAGVRLMTEYLKNRSSE